MMLMGGATGFYCTMFFTMYPNVFPASSTQNVINFSSESFLAFDITEISVEAES